MMVFTVDSCNGPRAYLGPVFWYYERIAGGVTRISDSEWVNELDASPPADVSWMQSLIGGA